MAIMGSHRSTQIQNEISVPYTKNDTAIQSDVRFARIDRDATTCLERERARRIYTRELEVRYFSSLKNLKDRLLAGYWCDESQCPMIRKRLESHLAAEHGKRPCEKQCEFSRSKLKNCVSIKAGPDFDQFFGPKTCTDCPVPSPSNGKSKANSVINTPVKRNYHENCGKSAFDTKTDIKPIKESLRSDTKSKDGTSTPINSCCLPNSNNTTDLKLRSKGNEMSTGPDKYEDATQFLSSNNAKDFVGRYERPRIATDNCANEWSSSNHGNFRNGNVCDKSDYSGYNTNENRDYCGIRERPIYDGCSTSSYGRTSRYVDCSNDPCEAFIINSSRDTASCCVGSDVQYDQCTHNDSYTGNIQAPRYVLVSTDDSTPKDRCKLDSEVQATYNDVPMIIKLDVGTDNSCTMSVDAIQKPSENEAGCSKPNEEVSTNDDKTDKKSSKSKITKGFKTPYFKNPVESSTSYKLVPPYSVDRSSNDLSEISIKTTRPRRSSNPIYREVKEWIREVPLYPGLGKEAKQSNKQVINNLISNLYELSREAGSKEYDDKVRNEIDECLNKIPLWYPGAKREQKGYKRSLVDRLHRRLKGLNKRNSSRSQTKRRRKSSTEIRTSMVSSHHSYNRVHPKDLEIRICVMDWLRSMYCKTIIYHKIENQIGQMADFVVIKLKPLLNKQMGKVGHRVLLKTAITHIMNDLPKIVSSQNENTISSLAEDLAERVLAIEENYADIYETVSDTSCKECCKKCFPLKNFKSISTKSVPVQNCFKDTNIECNNVTSKQLYSYYDIYNARYHKPADAIIDLLITFTNLSEDEASKLTEVIMKKVRQAINEGNVSESSQTDQFNQNAISTYTSIGDMANSVIYLLTSTPKKKTLKKEIPKLNKQEIQYIDDLSKLIRTWMTTLPEKFDGPDEKQFKETMIRDLASDIEETMKVEQLVGPKDERKKVLQYVACRWVLRLGAFEIEDVMEQINELVEKVEEIPVPVLTQPQHGNRQALTSTKVRQAKDAKWAGNNIQKGIDILEDEISIWMNEQPSSLFVETDKKKRQDKVHDLAKTLHNNLGSKRPSTEVGKDIQQWLNKVLRPDKKQNVGQLTEYLKDRVIKLPQDQTLARNMDDRIKYREEQIKLKTQNENAPKIHLDEVREEGSPEQENTMSIFISKFIERHYDVDDPLARRAFNRLLNSHLLRLSPPTRKEVYENFENKQQDDRFPQKNMVKELEYIKDISDWLKNLPLDANFNTLGNKDRTDFVNSLAISIREIEDDRERNPCAMDYDKYMVVMILEHLKLLSLPQDFLANPTFMVDQLYRKIISHRQNVEQSININESMSSTGINPDNIGDFIEEFIKINGADIAQDDVKMEAWAIRLIREIKKILQTSQQSALSKAQVFEKLTDVPIPTDETAKYFDMELDYVKEITNWIKNLPLLPMTDRDKDNVTVKICNLAEIMVEADKKLIAKPKQKRTIENELQDYITKWISELPLDKNKKIVYPLATQQLLNRMAKVKRDSSTDVKKSGSSTSSKSKKSRSSLSKGKKSKDVDSSKLVDTIEKWSKSLPIKSENDESTKNIKNDVTRQLCQIIGQLNMDHTVYNDDTLYKNNLKDEINNMFETLPQNHEVNIKQEKLADELIDKIIDFKNEIKEKAAGESYKQTLDRTIDASIPDPVPTNQVYDPGFEIYKNRLATMFILENFDHGTDEVKEKHEQLLRKEIDKYFDHAINRNATLISKDQLYSVLYGNLFKIPVPNEASVIDEVEKLKTRCEIDAWFEELPLKESQGLTELLDCDKILSSLATQIHKIETEESKPDSKILKEIMKSLSKLPLQAANKAKLEEFAANLQKRLKSTTSQRKCILENAKKGKRDKSKSKIKESRPSSSGYQTNSPSTENTTEHRTPRKNASDEIYGVIQYWCNQLPISAEGKENVQEIKDELTTKIMIKISEINGNSEIFDNNDIYFEEVGREIENILSSIPAVCGQCPSKAARINQLKEAIKKIKPIIVEEKATRQFKQDLNSTVERVLEKPPNIACEEKLAFLDIVKNEIVDNFIQYNYADDNNDIKQNRKTDILENISTYTAAAISKDGSKDSKKKDVKQNESKTNMLMKTNQLITELTKVFTQNDTIVRDEIEEIRMKKQVSEFFDQMHIPDKKDDKIKVSYAKESLAKRLNELELNSHTPEIDNKMKKAVEKCLKKLGKEKNQAAIDAFVAKLKSNEKERRLAQHTVAKVSETLAQKISQYADHKSLDSLENYCKRVCNKYPRIKLTNRQTASNVPACCSQPNISQNYILPQNIPGNISHTTAGNGAKYDPENYDRNIPSSPSKKDKAIKTCPLQTNDDDEEESSVDDEKSESDLKTQCLCKASARRKKRAYCMVPMRHSYICEGYDSQDYFWCRMPLRGSF